MMIRSRSFHFRISVLLAVLLALPALAGTPAFSAEKPIKIGAFFDLSGPASSIGTPTKLVAEMVVDKVNQEGGIEGRPIELVIGDTKGDPTEALKIVKRFISEDVTAIIGPTRTGTGMAVKKEVESKGVPIVMTVGGDPVIMGGRFGPYHWTFKAPQRTASAVGKVYGYLKDQGMTKVAILNANDGFGRFGLNWLKKLAPEYGVEIVGQEAFAVTDAEMTTQLTKLRGSGAEVIVCWTIGPAGARVAKNVKQLGIELPLFQCHGLPDPKYIELAGEEAAEGNLMPSTKLMVADQIPDSDPQKAVIREFIRLYEEEYNYDEEYPINTHSGYAWDAIYILANAMRQAGTDPKPLRDAIEQTEGYVGISGIYNMSEEDHNGLDTSSLVIVKIKDGKWLLEAR